MKHFTMRAMSLAGLVLLFGASPSAGVEVCGLIPDGEVWRVEDSPVQVTCNLNIAGLRVDPGVEVLVDGDFEIVVNGTIRALGTAKKPVVFKPADANTEGWEGFYFEDAIPGSEFRWCEIEGSNSSGIHLVRSNPAIAHCTFRDNAAAYGGAIRVQLGEKDQQVTDSFFVGNYASTGGGAICSIGPTDTDAASLEISRSVFVDNHAGTTGSSTRHNTYGGALANQGNVRIQGCTFHGNQSRSYTIYTSAGRYTRGGAVYTEGGRCEIAASAFIDNACRMGAHGYTPDRSFAYGGAVHQGSGVLWIQNSLLAENSLYASGGRGAVYYRGSAVHVAAGDGSIVNSTLADNRSHSAVYTGEGSVEILNSILFFNNDSGEQISGAAAVTYSDVQNGHDGEGNISYDPIFDPYYRIVPPSPCIDAGSTDPEHNDAIPPGLSGLRNDMGYTGGPLAAGWNVGVCFRDADGDGYGDPTRYAFLESCASGYIVDDGDCDDTRADVHPGAEEICDGVDNNCDDDIDEEPASSTHCDDGLFCNGEEVCSGGACRAGTPVDCDDGVSCTADTCNETTGECAHVPDDALCNDGLFCDGVETCSATEDCQPGGGDPCAEGLVCDEGGDACLGCLEDGHCDDGFFCNGQEICDAGECRSGTPVECDDGVGCTVDTCNEGAGRCENVPDDAACNDGRFCNGTERCDPAAGCQAADGDPCAPLRCDEVSDLCVDCLTDAQCDDGVYCNGSESCVGSACVAGTPVNCDDGVGCTDDHCSEEAEDCRHTPNDTACDDGIYCNGQERCSARLGCEAGTEINCDDGDACTEDSCNEGTDACDHVCMATGPADACCGSSACEGDAVCGGGCSDQDADGYGDPASGECRYSEPDCDDARAAVNPGRREVCGDALDNDCDGDVDGSDTECPPVDVGDPGEGGGGCGCAVFGPASRPLQHGVSALLYLVPAGFVLVLRRRLPRR